MKEKPTLAVMSEIVSRMALAARMGQQYGGDRDVYRALGYKLELTYDDMKAKYKRQDMAKAIIDRPINTTWRGDISILESNDSKQTQLEKTWSDLYKTLKLKSKLMRLDRLTGLGRYGVLLFGFSDISKREDWIMPVKSGSLKLLYVKPFGEDKIQIKETEKDTKNERYGLPTHYQITVSDAANESSHVIIVHYSRVLHVVDETLDSEVYGTPRLEIVYNRLMDLEKLTGGSAEMFWRGARPGYQGKIDSEYTMTPDQEDKLQDQVAEFEHNLRRIFVNEGIDLEALASQVADPKNHIDIQIQMISAVTGIPKRILTGSERGELSSSQDQEQWLSFIQTRREEFAETNILRPIIDKLIGLNILPKPKEDYSVQWTDLFAMSEQQQAAIGKTRAEALQKYASSPMAESVVPPKAFFEFFLGLKEEEIELIEKMRTEQYVDDTATKEEEEIINKEENLK